MKPSQTSSAHSVSAHHKPKPNTAKGASYAEAWRRIKRANSEGFYFESVALCESIMADRLLSFALGMRPHKKLSAHSNFGDLIKTCQKIIEETEGINTIENNELMRQLDEWRISRNGVIHGVAKSMPGMPTIEVGTFVQIAADVAKNGERLARKIQKWQLSIKKPNKSVNGDSK